VTEESPAQQLDITRILAGLRRRKRMIAAIVLATGTMAVVLSLLQTPIYQGAARIALDPPGGTAVFEPVTASARIDPALIVETELEVLKSDTVRALVAEQLGPVGEVDATRVGDTLLIEVKGSSTEPERATAVTNAYARTYLELRRQQAADDLLETGGQLRDKVAELQAQIDALDLGAEQRDALVEQQARFGERLNQLEIEAALQSGGGEIVSESSVPSEPVSPTPVRNLLLALVVGSLIGLSMALVMEYRDDSIKALNDLVDAIKPLPVLGSLPVVAGWQREPSRPHLVTDDQADSLQAGEAYRALRTAVSLLGVERPLTTIQLTSALPGDGKTTTLANLAVVLATAGQRVVLVDCDLRRPNLHAAFQVDNAVGFISVLAGEVELSAAIQPIRAEGELSLLASGGLAPNPSELLGSKRTSELLFALQSDFDVVLVDSPPVLSVTDAAVLSVWVDTTLIVTSAGTTTRNHLRSTVAILRQAGAPVGGAILNRADSRFGYGYGYDSYGERSDGRRTGHGR
jgi:capsular exopolysaccharide synthesis family protein